MQQLDDSQHLFLPMLCDDAEQVEQQVTKLAQGLAANLTDISLGADVWFACLHLDEQIVQIHYDWLSEGFWLSPTGLLVEQFESWQSLQTDIQRVFAN